MISLQTSEGITGLGCSRLLQTRQCTQGKKPDFQQLERLCFVKAKECQSCGWVEDKLMLQLRGVRYDKRKGSCVNYLGLARSEATLPQFLQGNIFLALPQVNQEIVLFHTFVVLIRNIPVEFWLMFCVKHSRWGLCCDALLDGSSTPCFLVELQCCTGSPACWLWSWSYDQVIIHVLSSTVSIAPYPAPES